MTKQTGGYAQLTISSINPKYNGITINLSIQEFETFLSFMEKGENAILSLFEMNNSFHEAEKEKLREVIEILKIRLGESRNEPTPFHHPIREF